MSEINHLSDLIAALSNQKINFIVCGGVAVVLQGVERATMDLDISAEFETDNLKKIISVMKEQGMKPRAPVAAEILLDEAERNKMLTEKNALVFTFVHPDRPFLQLDIFLSKDLKYENLLTGTEIIEINGLKINVLTRKKLLEIKRAIQPVRTKDLFDITELERLEDAANGK